MRKIRALTLKEFSLISVSVMFLNCLDIVLTIYGLSLGAYELNPLFRSGFNAFLIGYKSLSLILILIGFIVCYREALKSDYKLVKIILSVPLIVLLVSFIALIINNTITIFLLI